MKTCRKCLETKNFVEFGSHCRMADGLQSRCKACIREDSLVRKKSDRRLIKLRQWHADNPTMKHCPRCDTAKDRQLFAVDTNRADGRSGFCRQCHSELRVQRYRKDPSIEAAAAKVWRRENRAKRVQNTAEYRIRKIQALPKWAEPDKIAEFYETAEVLSQNFGISFHVDHVIPLRGRHVCGLHVQTNLQIIPGNENLTKGNRF